PDKAAAALAAKENASDAIGGVPLAEQVDDPEVERILGDMFRRDSLDSSQLLAESIIRELARIGPVKYAEPKRARFVVLGAMEIPSVLVEMDYLSNPERERRLRDRRHQERIATALLRGSVRFLERMGRLKPAGGSAQAARERATASL
ncbi:MAG: N-acetylmuramoyl-L-alanine amidase, partial [Mariprofundaceae bacterium]